MKSKSAITLVALIITIIVLLILATVSISLIINNGILNKAQYGIDKYSEEEELEQIKLAVASAMLKGNGFLDTNNLNSELQDRLGKDAEQIGNFKKWNLKLDKNYIIYENGEVEKHDKLLPEEYQQVEYIESSGTQYIDTNVKDESGIIWKIGVAFTTIEGRRLMGANQGLNFACRNGILQIGAKDTIHEIEKDIRIQIEMKRTLTDRIIIVDNIETVGTQPKENNNIYICGLDMGGYNNIATPSETFFGRCYSSSIYREELQIRNFIPCYSTTTVTDVDGVERLAGTAGLYDTVEGKFYVNKGTGTFGYETLEGTYVAPTNN